MTNLEFITIQEFCKILGIKSDNWIFKDMNPENEDFEFFIVKGLNGDSDVYYFNNGNGTIRAFKFMNQYGEIWHSVCDLKSENPIWFMWSTWKLL